MKDLPAKNSTWKPDARRQARGSVLFLALMFVIIATSVMLSVCSATFNNSDRTTDLLSREESYFAAKGINDLVFSDIKYGFNKSGAADLVTYLTNKYSWSAVSPGVDMIADSFRTAKDAFNPAITVTFAVYRADLSQIYKDISMGTMQPGRVKVYRRDRPADGTGVKKSDLILVTEAQRNLGYNTSYVQMNLAIPNYIPGVTVGQDATWVASVITSQSPPTYSGFEFAILTKNLTCTLCHLKVQDLSRVVNKNTALYNTFNRVKVGTTQFLATRPGSSASNIEGTLYHRGKLEDEQAGTALSISGFTGSTNKSVSFNGSAPVTITQNGSGATTQASFVNQTSGTIDPITGATTTPPPVGGNLYLNYPLTSAGQTDGFLPTSDFPAPFTEILKPLVADPSKTLTNSKVDPDEISTTIANYNNPGNSTASITGGVVSITPLPQVGGVSVGPQVGTTVPPLTQVAGLYYPTTIPQYTATTLPSSGSAASIHNGDEGNMILTGTPANPIMLNGTVVIKGDVMISGTVEGTGQIYATGNIYVPGDVTYNNAVSGGSEVFGQSPSGKTNLMGLIAGGNIVIGDYLSGVTHWDSGKPDFVKPNYNGTGVTGQVDPGINIPYYKSGGVEKGTQNPYTDLAGMGTVTNNAGVTVGNSNMANFTVEQLAVFNREELIKSTPLLPVSNNIKNAANYTGTNPLYDPNHTPRFYTMYPDNFNPYNNTAYTSQLASVTAAKETKAADPTTHLLVAGTGAQTDAVTGKPLPGTGHSPIPLFVNNNSPWDPTKMRFNTAGDPHTYNTLSELTDLPTSKLGTLAQDANILSISPSWIAPDIMLKILSDTEHNRPSSPRRVDGLLYTNNAIFAVERKQANYWNGTTWSKQATKSSGQMTVNGALIAPDMGILVTGNNNPAFLVNYDARVKQFLPITSSDSTIYDINPQSYTHGSGLLK